MPTVLVLWAALCVQKPPKALPPCDLTQSGEAAYCETCKDYVDGEGQTDKKTGLCATCSATPAKRKICDKGGWLCEKCGVWFTKKGKCKEGHDEVELVPKFVRCNFVFRCPG